MNTKSIYILLIALASLHTDIHTCAKEAEDVWFLSTDKMMPHLPKDVFVMFRSGGDPNRCSIEQASQMAATILQDRDLQGYFEGHSVPKRLSCASLPFTILRHVPKQSPCTALPFIKEDYVWQPMGIDNSTELKKNEHGLKLWQQLLSPQVVPEQPNPEQKNAFIRVLQDINTARTYWKKKAQARKTQLAHARNQKNSLQAEAYMHIVSPTASLLALNKQEQQYQSSLPIAAEQLQTTKKNVTALRTKVPADIQQRLDGNIETRNALLKLLQLENQIAQLELLSASDLQEHEARLSMQKAQKLKLYNAWSSYDESAFTNKQLFDMALHEKRRDHLASHPDANVLEITLSNQEFVTYVSTHKLKHLFANISQQEYELLQETFPASFSFILPEDSTQPIATQSAAEMSTPEHNAKAQAFGSVLQLLYRESAKHSMEEALRTHDLQKASGLLLTLNKAAHVLKEAFPELSLRVTSEKKESIPAAAPLDDDGFVLEDDEVSANNCMPEGKPVSSNAPASGTSEASSSQGIWGWIPFSSNETN